MAWRALAQLQIELEEAGEAPLARGARAPEYEEYGEYEPMVVREPQPFIPPIVRRIQDSLGTSRTPIDIRRSQTWNAPEQDASLGPKFEHDGP